jgi:hypothetical protein
MSSTSPLRTGMPACVMGLLREEAGSQHLAMSQRSPQFSQALNEFCSGLIKCYEDAHLDYKPLARLVLHLPDWLVQRYHQPFPV